MKRTGGVMCLSNPQLTLANHLCCLTSLAPELDPTRLCSSLMSNLRIADLHRLNGISVQEEAHYELTHLVTGLVSGNVTSFFSTFANVAFRLGPLNGVVANYTLSASRRFRLHERSSIRSSRKRGYPGSTNRQRKYVRNP